MNSSALKWRFDLKRMKLRSTFFGDDLNDFERKRGTLTGGTSAVRVLPPSANYVL